MVLLPSAAAYGAYAKTTPNAASTIWQPGGVQQTKSVPGSAATSADRQTAAPKTSAVTASPDKPAKITWPSGSATVALSPASASGTGKTAAARAGSAKKAGSLPISLAGDDVSKNAARQAAVSFASRQVVSAAGVAGVIFTLSRSDGGSTPSPTQVTLNYSSFASAYGGGYADRLKLVELPACALTTPQLAKCRTQTPVTFTSDQKAGTLTATVDLGGVVTQNTVTKNAVTNNAVTQNTVTQNTAMVLAATSSAAGSVGAYSATSLPQAGSWSAGGSSGAFTYSYPISEPPTTGGAAPDVTLSYNSASVDGRTSATNAQASWIGDGWDYAPGYVERSYQP
jgi:hypothetical protein